jgi:hypothetical protein
MTKKQKQAAICVMLLLGAVGIYIASGYLHRPRMSMFEVIQIAGRAAQAEGFHVSEYQNPDAKFEFPDRNRTWTVIYNLKLPSPWGPPLPKPESAHGAPRHFFVTVDDRTKRTRVGMLQSVGNERPVSLPPGAKILGRYTNEAWSNSNTK